jgi:hypothetical protein
MGNHRPGRDEQLIAEDFVAVLDYLSRVMQGLDEGHWHYAREKTAALAEAAERLFDRLSAEPRRSGDTWPALARVHADPVRLRAVIAQYGRHYAAGRALYPAGGAGAEPDAAGAGT